MLVGAGTEGDPAAATGTSKGLAVGEGDGCGKPTVASAGDSDPMPAEVGSDAAADGAGAGGLETTESGRRGVKPNASESLAQYCQRVAISERNWAEWPQSSSEP